MNRGICDSLFKYSVISTTSPFAVKTIPSVELTGISEQDESEKIIIIQGPI